MFIETVSIGSFYTAYVVLGFGILLAVFIGPTAFLAKTSGGKLFGMILSLVCAFGGLAGGSAITEHIHADNLSYINAQVSSIVGQPVAVEVPNETDMNPIKNLAESETLTMAFSTQEGGSILVSFTGTDEPDLVFVEIAADQEDGSASSDITSDEPVVVTG